MLLGNRWRIVAATLAVGFAAGITVGWAASTVAHQTEVNGGLVNAADSVLKNLLGSAVASVQAHEVPPDPPRVLVHLNTEASIPTDIMVFSPDPAGSTCQNVARVSVDNGQVTLTRDSGAGIELQVADLNTGLPSGPNCE